MIAETRHRLPHGSGLAGVAVGAARRPGGVATVGHLQYSLGLSHYPPNSTMAKKQLTYAECDALITAPGSEFEMITVLEGGHQQRVWKNAPPDFRTFFEGVMQQWAERVLVNEAVPEPAEYDARQDVTYGQALDNAYALAAWLREQGVGRADRVAIGGPNSSYWLTAFVAISLLGAVPVCLNSTL